MNRTEIGTNILVAAINTALERGYFTLGAKPDRVNRDYDATLPVSAPTEGYRFALGGVPVVAYARHGGWDEVRISVVAFPDEDALARYGAICFHYGDGSHLRPGGLHARGWLERRLGNWLQDKGATLYLSSRHRPALAAVPVIEPLGFARDGRMML